MPNHIETTLKLTGSKADLDALSALMLGADEDKDKNPFDLNKAIPMPPALRLVVTGGGWIGHGDHKVSVDNWIDIGKERIPVDTDALTQAYGAANWYDWAVKHWGTKWNSYDGSVNRISDTELEYVFNTAWAEPKPVLESLAARFPNVHFDVHVGGETYDGNTYGYTLNGQALQ